LRHKGDAGEVREDLQLTSIESCAMKMKIGLISHQKFVRQVWIVSQYPLKMTTNL